MVLTTKRIWTIRSNTVLERPRPLSKPRPLAAVHLSVSKSDGAALTVKCLVRVKTLKNLNPAVSH